MVILDLAVIGKLVSNLHELLTNSPIVKLCMNYCSNQKTVENGLLAFILIHLLKYFHDFREFFEIVICIFQKWTSSYWLEPQQHYPSLWVVYHKTS
jgi:hypothetical protein